MNEQRGGGVLITGGTGFLGRALAKELLREEHGHQRVCIYSRGEHAQADMFEALGSHPNLRMFVGDVRDRERLYWALRSVDIVIHAAALKRIEVGHYNPGELVKTNILGTANVVDAAIAAGVRRVVLVSTDKACQPVSPYGVSKAMAEAVVLAANNTVAAGGTTFAVCRYGNVAGSTGSVIPRWRRILDTEPNPLAPCTDQDCTRFWMTQGEAVALVLRAVQGVGPLLIPKLPAFRLGDLAEAMGFRGTLEFGLADWEKKHEMLEPGVTSDCAERMTVGALKEALLHV